MVHNKVLNEYDFPPLELLHFVLLGTKIGRHYKGAFHLTAKGKKLKNEPGKLWENLADFLIFRVDHAHSTHSGERPLGNWDIFFNVINVEAQQGISTKGICKSLYGEPEANSGYNSQYYDFYFTVLQPLSWAGLLTEIGEKRLHLPDRFFVKSPLWQATIKLDTDDFLTEIISH